MSSLKKKCTAILLPTEKITTGQIVIPFGGSMLGRLIQDKPNDYRITFNTGIYHEYEDAPKGQHLYICSTDEIKEGDWVIVNEKYLRRVVKVQSNQYLVVGVNNAVFKNVCKKIIATTDSNLYIHGDKMEVKQPKGFSQFYSKQLSTVSNSFIQAYIEAYNEGNPIKEVMVDYQELDVKGNITFEDDIDNLSYSATPRLRGNEIIITKVKDSWSREELIELIKKFDIDPVVGRFNGPTTRNQWIEQNI